MRIRLRATGAVMFEDELRRWAKDNGGPAWDRTTPEVLEALGADPVFEGPQASPLEFWQFSMQQGVEQVGGKWYTKYVPGPIFDKPEDQAAWIAQKSQERDAALQARIVQATQDRLDTFARERHYDDIKSASSYAGCSVPKFDIEGTYCRDARALTWDALYSILDEVQAGTRPKPTGFSDIEPDLPPLVWPT